jgi:formate dehydrogenase assembly factor FdhD
VPQGVARLQASTKGGEAMTESATPENIRQLIEALARQQEHVERVKAAGCTHMAIYFDNKTLVWCDLCRAAVFSESSPAGHSP